MRCEGEGEGRGVGCAPAGVRSSVVVACSSIESHCVLDSWSLRSCFWALIDLDSVRTVILRYLHEETIDM
jgi:hypothetical protein